MNRKDILNIKIQTQRIDKVYDITQKGSKLGKGNFGVVVRAKDKGCQAHTWLVTHWAAQSP